jgi:glycosyltransferase involved in cell wall biosynthesis
MEPPFFSLIVPVYNTEKYIEQCLNSILTQDYLNYELIIVDDGSTDNSGLICDSYAKKDSRIIIKHQLNGGLSAARNSGLKIAKGEYIWFIDSDDWIKENCLSFIINELKNDGVEMLGFSMTDYFESSNSFSDPFLQKNISVTNGNEYIKLNGMFYSPACSYIYKLSFLRSNQILFKERLIHEDDYFNLICFSKIKKIKKIPFGLYYYRRRENSISSSKVTIQRIHSFIELIRLCIDLRKSNLDSSFIEKQIFSYSCVLFSLINKIQLSINEKKAIIKTVQNLIPNQLILNSDTNIIKVEKHIYNQNSSLFYFYINNLRWLRTMLELLNIIFFKIFRSIKLR